MHHLRIDTRLVSMFVEGAGGCNRSFVQRRVLQEPQAPPFFLLFVIPSLPVTLPPISSIFGIFTSRFPHFPRISKVF